MPPLFVTVLKLDIFEVCLLVHSCSGHVLSFSLSLSLSRARARARTYTDTDIHTHARARTHTHARAWLSSRRCCHRGVSRLHAGRGAIVQATVQASRHKGVSPGYIHADETCTQSYHQGTYTLTSHAHRVITRYIHADVTCTQDYHWGTYTRVSHAHKIITGVHSRGCHVYTSITGVHTQRYHKH